MTAIVLTKTSGKINLKKEFPGLKKIRLVLEWTNPSNGTKVDADASAFVCDGNSKLLGNEYFVFYGSQDKACPQKAVVYGGDSRQGGTETITVDLEKVTDKAQEIAFVITMYESKEKGLTFGELEKGGITLYNDETGDKLASYAFGTGEYTKESLIHMASLYKGANGWEYEAFGKGAVGKDLGDALVMFGADV